MPDLSRYSHTWSGIFLVGIPTSLVSLFLYYLLLRRPLLALSPDAIRLRVGAEHRFHQPTPSAGFWIVCSALLGIVTHVLWDSFTHAYGFLVIHWSLLREGTPFWPYRPIYKFLQPFFSLFGLIAIAYAYRCWIANTPPVQGRVVPALASTEARIGLIAGGVSIIGFSGLLYAYFSLQTPAAGFWSYFAEFLFGSMAFGLLSVVAFATWWHLRSRQVRR